MMKRGKHIIRNYMTLDYEFSGIRIQDAFMSSVDWRLTVNLTAPEKKSRSKEEAESRANTAFQKIYFWLETNLPNIVVVNVNSESDLLIANLSSNIMMYCPGGTSDDIIIQLLHSKMTALADKDLIVGEMKLKGSDSTILYTFDCEDDMYAMPATTAEYYTEGTARDNEPWWSRNDGFCFEFIRPGDSKLTDEELFKDISDPLQEFHRMMSETDPTFGKVNEPARIVQVEKWKPRKVD
jgi:hypothetical protein